MILLLGVNYTLEVDPQLIRQGLASRVNLISETSPGSMTGSLMLSRDTSECVNTRALVKVRIAYACSFNFQYNIQAET